MTAATSSGSPETCPCRHCAGCTMIVPTCISTWWEGTFYRSGDDGGGVWMFAFLPGRAMMRRAIASLATLGISTAAMAQPCQPGPRLFETDRAAYEAQARRVFAAHGIPYAEHRHYELDHRLPRCLALGDYDGDDNLRPQPRAEALIKDDMEAEVCRRVCQFRTMSLEYAVELFTDWRAGYRIVFGHAP